MRKALVETIVCVLVYTCDKRSQHQKFLIHKIFDNSRCKL